MATPRTTPAPEQSSWRTTIDGWVRDPDIRKFGLTILIVFLTGAALIVGLASDALLDAVNTMLPSLLAKGVAASVFSATGGGLLVLKHRARRRRTTSAVDNEPNQPSTPPARAEQPEPLEAHFTLQRVTVIRTYDRHGHAR